MMNTNELETDLEEERYTALRRATHPITLTNQEIIQFAYAHRDLIAPLIQDHNKLCFEEANCFRAVYYQIREMLKIVDPEYLVDRHAEVVGFYESELTHDWDRLYRYKLEPLEPDPFAGASFIDG